MSSADMDIYRSSNGYYDKKRYKDHCKNCGKDITSLFHFDFCSQGCGEAYKLKKLINK